MESQCGQEELTLSPAIEVGLGIARVTGTSIWKRWNPMCEKNNVKHSTGEYSTRLGIPF